MNDRDLLIEIKNADNFKFIYPKLYDEILILLGELRRRNIIHMEDYGRKGYYLCNWSVGKHDETNNKLTKMWSKVTCQNCLMRRNRK